MTTAELQHAWVPGTKKKYWLLFAAGLIVVVLVTAWTVCERQYKLARQMVLADQQSVMEAWLKGAVEATSLWTKEIDELGRRISTSELFSLYAADVEQLGEAAASVINTPDALGEHPSAELVSLSEQVPMMRNLLVNVASANNLLDIRLLNRKGQTILSSLLPAAPVDDDAQKLLADTVASNAVVFGPIRDCGGELVMEVAEPVVATLGKDDKTPVATLHFTTSVEARLTQVLSREHSVKEEGRPHLIQVSDNTGFDITLGKQRLVFRKLTHLPQDLKNGWDFGRRSSLASLDHDQVYSAAVRVPASDLWMALELPTTRIQNKMRNLALLIYGLGVLASLGVVLLCALLWWIMVGKEERLAANYFRRLYTVILRQKHLLDSVNASLGAGLLFTDPDGKVLMCNRAFSEIFSASENDVTESMLSEFVDTVPCQELLRAIKNVAEGGTENFLEVTLCSPTGQRLYRVTLFPVTKKAMDKGIVPESGAVLIFQDITEFRRKSEMRRRQQAKTIEALLRAIETVDPYLSGHSQMMVSLTSLMTQKMELGERDRETVRSAAGLSQLGKLFVPRGLLTKTSAFTPQEREEVMRAPDYANNILRDIDFGLPVSRAVYEMSERMDGRGYPQHLKGEAICLPARVLAVANAFCAMVSSRSFRKGIGEEDAVLRLQKGSSSFDPNVVQALKDVILTVSGQELLAHFREFHKNNSLLHINNIL